VQNLNCYALSMYLGNPEPAWLNVPHQLRVGVAALCGDTHDWPIATGGVDMESTTTHTIGVARVEFTS
jgi:hypothetical protein